MWKIKPARVDLGRTIIYFNLPDTYLLTYLLVDAFPSLKLLLGLYMSPIDTIYIAGLGDHL